MAKEKDIDETGFEDFQEELIDSDTSLPQYKSFVGHFFSKVTPQRGLILPEGILRTLRAWQAESVMLWRETLHTVSLITLQIADEIEASYKTSVLEKISDPEFREERNSIRKFYKMLISNKTIAPLAVNGKITLSKEFLDVIEIKPGQPIHLVGLGKRLILLNAARYEEFYGSEAEKRYFKYQSMFKEQTLELPEDFSQGD